MTTYIAGPTGAGIEDGSDWDNRLAGLNAVEDLPITAGDTAYFGPGIYREELTCDVSGGNTYVVGTVTVTNGSTTVTGAGTAFLANVAIADMFHVAIFASGADGVANGTATFTSAAGNFQANMVGKVIQINARHPYTIGAVAAANSITLIDVNGVGWPGAGGGLTYSVMSGEGPYEIESITDDTNFELVRPWCGPTLTGLAYITYRPIRYIGDVTGENTDGVGGIVRITGSDNDQTVTRNTAITNVGGQDYRLFRGLQMDMGTWQGFMNTDGSYITIEECFLTSLPSVGIAIYEEGSINVTVRRCVMHGIKRPIMMSVTAWPGINDSGHVIENCVFIGGIWHTISCNYYGGVTTKNCTFVASYRAISMLAQADLGQTWVVNNCSIESAALGIDAWALGNVTEDYNTLFGNNTDRANTAVGTNSVSYPLLLKAPLLKYGFLFPWQMEALSEWSQTRTIAGIWEACHDLHGFVRPATAAKKSWGAVQFVDAERDTNTIQTGSASIAIKDAGRMQIKVPHDGTGVAVAIKVYRESDYAGILPQMIIKQPGQADRTTVDTGSVGSWNNLLDTFTPAANPNYFIIELVSNNTAISGSYVTYFDTLKLSGNEVDVGNFEHWLWDRQPFDIYARAPAEDVTRIYDTTLYDATIY